MPNTYYKKLSQCFNKKNPRKEGFFSIIALNYADAVSLEAAFQIIKPNKILLTKSAKL